MKVNGKTTEEKFKQVEAALNRLERKTKQKKVYAIPPIPIFIFSDNFNESTFGRYMFPAPGYVKKLSILTTFKDKFHEFDLTIGFFTGDTTKHKRFTLGSGFETYDFYTEVNNGDRLTFSVSDLPENIESIWLGFLYQIKPSYSLIKEFELESKDEGANE